MKEEKKELKEPKKVKLSNKNILLIVIGIVLVSLAGTFAWFTWRSNDTALVLTVGDISSAQVTLKPYKINAELAPTTSYENEVYTNVTAVNNSTTSKKVSLYYHINKIDSELISTSFKYTITKSTDNGSTYTEYKTGNFSTAANNIDLYIMDETVDGNNNIKYKVYIWLDGTGPNEGVAGKSFSGELRAKIEDISGPHYLYLSNGSFGMGNCIKSITFMPNTAPPNSSLTEGDTFDVTDSTDAPSGYEGKVVLYSVANGDGSDIYIGSTEGKVYAPPDSSSLFANDNCLVSINGMENFDTSMVESMSSMFDGAENLTTLDLSHFDTSNVSDMTSMFSECYSLESLNLSSFNTSNVGGMSSMFYNCQSLTSLDLSNFDTSNVTDMSMMFNECYALKTLNLSSFDTSGVISMAGMFKMMDQEGSFTNLDLSNFDTLSVEDMGEMFWGTPGLTGTFTIARKLQYYDNLFYCDNAGKTLTVNYTSDNSDVIDDYLSKTTPLCNVVKGICIDC